MEGGGVADGVVNLVDDAGQAVAAVVPALTRHVTGFDGALDGAVLTTQLDGTEAAVQADPRLAGPEAAGISQTAVVGVGFVFQVEDGFQAIAQFFGTDDADLGTTPDAIIDLRRRSCPSCWRVCSGSRQPHRRYRSAGCWFELGRMQAQLPQRPAQQAIFSLVNLLGF